METLKHMGYWCGSPSEAFPEERDHNKCDEHPFKIYPSAFRDVKLVCTCKCRKSDGRAD